MLALLSSLLLSTSPCPICDYYLEEKQKFPVIAQIVSDTSISKIIYVNGDSLKETEFFLNLQINDPLYSGLAKNQKINLLPYNYCDEDEYNPPHKALVLLRSIDMKNFSLYDVSCIFDNEENINCDSIYQRKWGELYKYLNWTKNKRGRQSYIYNNEYRILANFKNKKLEGDFYIYNRINQLILKGEFNAGNAVGIWKYYQKQVWGEAEYKANQFEFHEIWSYKEYDMSTKDITKWIFDFIRTADSSQLVYDSVNKYWLHPDFIANKKTPPALR